MGKVQLRAGGGRVTVEGLAAGDLRSGTTVTVRQGSKVVQEVTGTLHLLQLQIGGAGSYNIKQLLPDVYQQLTAANFLFGDINVSGWINESNVSLWYWGEQPVSYATRTYNPETGILQVNVFNGDVNLNTIYNSLPLHISTSAVCYVWYMTA